MKDKLVFIDTETTGLMPGIHEVIECSIISENGEWSGRFKPERPYLFAEEAKGINKLYWRKLKNCKPLAESADIIADLLKDSLPVGQNVNFDLMFIKSWFILHNHPKAKYIPYRSLDLHTIAKLKLPQLPKHSLSGILQHFREPIEGLHTSLGDARMVKVAYEHLMKVK